MIIKLDKAVIKNLLLIVPFFELQSFKMLSELGIYVHICDFLLQLMSVSRIVITLFVFGQIIRNKIRISGVIVCTIGFVLFENIASFMNKSIYINYFVGSMTYIGFVIMCEHLIRKSREKFVKACMFFFGMLSILGAIQIIIMPFGFTDVTDKAFAVYLLGSKNTSFFYYIVFLFFCFMEDIHAYKKITKKTIACLLLFCVAAVMCDSMNSLGMLLILGMFVIIFNEFNRIRKFINPKFVICFVIALSIFVLLPSGRELFNPLLQVVGRNASFTGRDVLWGQAIGYFLEHPTFGHGINTVYLLRTGVIQDNAHSHYLDILSKYGLIVFCFDVAIPILALKKSMKSKRSSKEVVIVKSAIAGVLLLHSIIDHIPFYHYLLIMICIEQMESEITVNAFRTKNTSLSGCICS